MAEQVTVLARIKAKPGLEHAVKKQLLALIEPTRAEPGCLGYDLHQNSDDPTCFMFYENWAGAEELDAHLKKPHLKAFLDRVDELLAEPLDVTRWTLLS